jgi:hypothetical protein
MGVVLVLAVGMGWYVRSVFRQQDAVAAIRRAGGSVAYDWRWEGNNKPGTFVYPGKPLAPRWLANIVPADYVATVISVDLDAPAHADSANPMDAATLARIGRLGHLNSLWLNNRFEITDAGLAHLEGLNSLRDLQLDDTGVSDAGLAHLRGMTGLRKLCISLTRVTDNGVLELERALPRLWIFRSEEMPSPVEIARPSVDLDYARSQPVLRACGLLVHRAQSLRFRSDMPGFIATVEAICDLSAGDKLSLLRLAEARAGCLGLLHPVHTPDLTATQRQALQSRCTDRAIEALTHAVELGYDNIRRIEGLPEESRGLWNLHDHPAIEKLIAVMKARRRGQ